MGVITDMMESSLSHTPGISRDLRKDGLDRAKAYTRSVKHALAKDLGRTLERTGACLIACGGFGKDLLAPGSDLDAFLLADERMELPSRVYGTVEESVNRLGLDIEWYPSGSTTLWQSIVERHPILGSDVAFARRVAGNRKLFAEFESDVVPISRRDKAIEQYILWNVFYRRAQYAKQANSIWNPKYGAGGLRDITYMLAISKRLFGVVHSDVESLIGGLLEHDILDTAEARTILIAQDMLTALRFTDLTEYPLVTGLISHEDRIQFASAELAPYVQKAATKLQDYTLNWVMERHDNVWKRRFMTLANQEVPPWSAIAKWLIKSTSDDAEGLAYIAARRATEASVISELLEMFGDKSWLVRCAIAQNTATPTRILRTLGSSTGLFDADQRHFVHGNPNKPDEFSEPVTALDAGGDDETHGCRINRLGGT